VGEVLPTELAPLAVEAREVVDPGVDDPVLWPSGTPPNASVTWCSVEATRRTVNAINVKHFILNELVDLL
jgi:hypothetical protein